MTSLFLFVFVQHTYVHCPNFLELLIPLYFAFHSDLVLPEAL